MVLHATEIRLVFFLAAQFVTTRCIKHSSNCSVSKTETNVHCLVSTWNPDLLEIHKVNKTLVKFLQIEFGNKSAILQRKHLEGLYNLESLIVIGACASRKEMGWCQIPAGLSAMEMDAFEGTPILKSLKLRTQPLKDINAISTLKRLQYLEIYLLLSLREFNASIFDNMRHTLKCLWIWNTPINVITSQHFENMRNLQLLELYVASAKLIIEPGGISNLPNLKSLMLAFLEMFEMSPTLVLKKNAIANVSHLEHVNLKNILRIEGLFNFSCTGNFNVVMLHFSKSTVDFFNRCPQLLFCEKCGQHPFRFPQTLRIEQPMLWMNNSPMFRMFPDKSKIPNFNTSNLYIYHSIFPHPFEMLQQMPLLKKFVVDHSHFVNSRRVIRFRDNPFTHLPSTARLDEVRITLKHCDCQLLEIIDWFKINNRFYLNKSVDEVLKFDCLIIDGVCSDYEKIIPRFFIKWTNLTLLAEKLGPICKTDGKKTTKIQPISPSECRCLKLDSCGNDAETTTPVAAFLLVNVLFFFIMVRG